MTNFDELAGRRGGRSIALHLVGSLLGALLLLIVLGASAALAGTTRPYETSFGPVNPRAIAVDQDTGDIYVADMANFNDRRIVRFDSTGAPKNFTQGPNAGTNTLTSLDFNFNLTGIAIDSSGGPLSGTIYVSYGSETFIPADSGIKIFRTTGASAGTLDGSTNPNGGFREPCALTVDQTNGALYIGQRRSFPEGGSDAGRVWRYMPKGPSASLNDDNFSISGIIASSCQVAAREDDVYVRENTGLAGPVHKFHTSEFDAQPLLRSGKAVDTDVFDVSVDPNTGDVYLAKNGHIAVRDAEGTPLYTFGAAAYFGPQPSGIALREAASGEALKVYVGNGRSEIAVFGAVSKVPRFTRQERAQIGPDGTSGSVFPADSAGLGEVAFGQSAGRLFVTENTIPAMYGFDASDPPAYPLLGDFDPLSIPALNSERGSMAVDNSGLSTDGNIYASSAESDQVYGWDPTGTPLGGAFPIDPIVTPGAPAGDPVDLCGVAVDSEGHIWVANQETDHILEYSAAGAFLSALDLSAQGSGAVWCKLAFAANDDLYIVEDRSPDDVVWSYTAASGYASGSEIVEGAGIREIALDPATEHLYVSAGDWLDEYDTSGGLISEVRGLGTVTGLTVDADTHDVYLADRTLRRVRVLSPSLLLPETSIRAASDLTNTSATLNGVVETQEVVLTDCHFEYVTEKAFGETGFSDLSSGGSVPCTPASATIPLDLEFHPVSAAISGLSADAEYRFRLIAANADGSSTTGPESFTAANPPRVETTGTPIRTATTAQLLGRVHPSRQETAFHFEYGSQGPCDANPCVSTPDVSAGSGNLYRYVAQTISGLQPNTTYHYRLIADNGNSDGSTAGESMSVTTRASNAPLTHGDLPGPLGSDRAYEQVSIADSGGNPVGLTAGFSDEGDRAVYGIIGGTPIAESGSFLSLYYSERVEEARRKGSWQTSLITPPRAELVGPNWNPILAPDDISSVIGRNWDDGAVMWKLGPGQEPEKLFVPTLPEAITDFNDGGGGALFGISGDATRTVVGIRGGEPDPAFPTAGAQLNLYDISLGTPELVTLMPDGTPSPCGGTGAETARPAHESHWISEDGSAFFFKSKGPDCGGTFHLYVRDLVANETKLVAANGTFLKQTPAGAFLATQESLEAGDTGGNDVYLYDLDSEELSCVTCVLPGTPVAVQGSDPLSIAVSDDGSRIYFASPNRLVSGVKGGFYRVEVGSGDLAYVGPGAAGGATTAGVALSHDGRFFSFPSSSPVLDAVGGWTNASTTQYYLYDDVERWLVCVSCPRNGAAPLEAVSVIEEDSGPNKDLLADDGTFAFTTTTQLVGADQNTPAGENLKPGTDIYEWRDGRQLLVSDGLTQWPAQAEPEVRGITPSGRDLFFVASAQYTGDAPDAYDRVYDARIGGGFEFPPPPKPCPLEVCQGTPKGVPEEQAPSTGTFVGPGNKSTTNTKPRARCPKGKRKVRRAGKTRCVKRMPNRANSNRRNAR